MKSSSKLLFFVAFAIVAYSCSPKGDGSVTEVNINGNKLHVFSLNDLRSDTAIISLSNLLDDCVLVQLESKDDAYINPWFTTVTNKYIGVRQRSNMPYLLFDRSGKFLCQVGSIGGGPGEYARILYDDIIDEKNGLVYLAQMNSDRILVYNTSGDFIKDIVAPHGLQKPRMYLQNDTLTVIHMPFSNNEAIAMQFDVISCEILKELAPQEHFTIKNFDGELFNTRNATGIYDFLHTGSDTLYHYDAKNNVILPAFTMSFDSSEKPYKQYYQLNKEMLLTNIFGKGLVATDIKNKTSSWVKVVNDYYGNLPAPTYIVQLRNGYWVHNIQPEQLMEDIEKRLTKRDCTEQDKQVLIKTLSTLEEGANNVVFIGKLKSDFKSKLW